MTIPQQPNVPPMPKTVPPKEKKITRAQKDKDRLAIIKEVAKMYGIEVIECEQGEGGFYAGDKKIEFKEVLLMRLHNDISNKDCIGQKVTAQPQPNSKWVTIFVENGTIYCDVYDKETGIIAYMDGETCMITGYNEQKKTVLLSNDNCILECIEIPYQQYKSDFGLNWRWV